MRESGEREQHAQARASAFRHVLAHEALPFLRDHRIGGVCVLPAAVQLEMALAAAKSLGLGAAFRLSDVAFQVPLRVELAATVEVILSLEPSGPREWSFQLRSGEVEHCRGRLAPLSAPAPRFEPLARLQEQFPARRPLAELARWYGGGAGIEYGPSLRALRGVWGASADGLCERSLSLVQSDAAAEEPAAAYALHPALLDGALQALWLTAAGADAAAGARSEPSYPFHIGRLDVLGRASGAVWCEISAARADARAGLLRGDLRLLSAQGLLLVEARDVLLKRPQAPAGPAAARRALARAIPAERGAFFHRVEWRARPLRRERAIPRGFWLVVADELGVGEAFAAQLRSRGNRVAEVRAGRAFEVRAAGSWAVQPGERRDFERLVAELGAELAELRGVVHLGAVQRAFADPATAAELEARLERGCASALLLVQALGTALRSGAELWLVTSDALAAEDKPAWIAAEGAALWGLGKVVAAEYPRLAVHLLDLSSAAGAEPAELAAELLEELEASPGEREIARRPGGRWAPELASAAPAADALGWPIRAGGRYLIAGGLGGLGLAIARRLAERGAGLLALLGRRSLPAREQWSARCQDGAAPAQERELLRSLLEIEALGARVLPLSADVADPAAVRAALSELAANGGPPHGVIHAAGLIRDGLVFGKRIEDLRAVLRPKVAGSWALARATQGLELDFTVLFSSLSGVLGNFGQADYAAANAYLDAWAARRSLIDGERVMALAWGPWPGVGMLRGGAAAGAPAVHGLEGIGAELGRELFEDALATPQPQWTLFRRVAPPDALAAPAAVALRAAVASSSEGAAPGAERADAAVPSLAGALREELRAILARVLSLERSELEGHTNWLELGLSSQMVIEVKSALESPGLVLDPSLFFRFPSIDELAEQLLAQHGPELAARFGLEGASAPQGASAEAPAPNAFLAERLRELGAEDRELQRQGLYFYEPILSAVSGAWVSVGSRRMLTLASYSYLDLIGHPQIRRAAERALERFGTGTHGVRLLAGTTTLHRELEARIARFKGTEDAIVYSSGYAANVATLSALVRRGDAVIGDLYNHASIVDGCRQSGASFSVFAHNDMADLERCLRKAGAAGKLVVADAVFSMDGDVLNLPAVVELCRRYGAALMIDEAHSLGVLGPTGRGIAEHFGLAGASIDIQMGTLSKAIPSIGGYVAGSADLIFALKNNARPFVFSAALPPPQVAAALAALDVIEAEPWRIAALREASARYLRGLNQLGLRTTSEGTSIVPVLCASARQAQEAARFCQERDVFIQPITYPAVPVDRPRLRSILTAAHRAEDVDAVLGVLAQAREQIGLGESR